MKKLFTTSINQQYLDLSILLVRLVIASFMFVHGIPKLGKFFAEGEIKFADPLGLGITFSLVLTVFSEVFCSIFILMGIGTRLAVIPLIITFIVIVFIVHSNDGFGKQELGLHYLLTYILLLVTGSGKYSVDHLLNKG